MNPVDLAVIRGRLQQITDEMDLVQTKAAFSPVVSEMWDRANAIIDARSSEVVMQGTTGLPIFVSTMQATVASVLEDVRDDLGDGDVLIINDPYLGGTHLQDVKMLRPLFVDGQLALVLINTGHIVDVGGASAGAFDPGTDDIFQEGLQIPPTWVVRDGKERADVLRLVLQNTRLPAAQEGDFRAQLNALSVGARRLEELMADHGGEQLLAAIDELGDRSERQMRSYLEQIPDGRYHFTDAVEAGADLDLAIEVELSVRGSDVQIDFAGSSPSYLGPMNLARPTTITAALSAFKHLFPDVPINGGCFRPFHFVFPQDCFLAARSPSAVGGYVEGATRVMEAIFGALAEVLPDQTTAASFGTGGVLSVSGDDQAGDFFATVFPMCGGYGASRGADGLVHGPTPIGLARFHSLEASEHEYPIRWDALAIREGSGGRGQWNGGHGTIFRLTALQPMSASLLGDRARHAPFGVAGGGPAARMEARITTAAGEIGGPGTNAIRGAQLQPGDVVELRSPGGGGYGPPDERSEDLVESDVLDGLID